MRKEMAWMIGIAFVGALAVIWLGSASRQFERISRAQLTIEQFVAAEGRLPGPKEVAVDGGCAWSGTDLVCGPFQHIASLRNGRVTWFVRHY